MYSGPDGGISLPLQRVTSLRRRAQADAPAASYRLRRVLWATAGAETRRVHRARGAAGGEACNASLPRFHRFHFRILRCVSCE